MKLEKTKFDDVFIIQPKIHEDSRGYFFESYNQRIFNEYIGKRIQFIQDNESQSEYGVMRGLHFQEPPYTQSKLIRVIKGAIIDIVIDIKTDSETFGEMLIVKLDSNEKKQLFIPRGYAHGYVAVEDDTIITYKVDNYYAPTFDSGFSYDSMKINFKEEVGHKEFIVSEKDQNLLPFNDIGFFKTFEYYMNF
jgi:dTDP-4-dehydrorhamnose 3,5-epimerase